MGHRDNDVTIDLDQPRGIAAVYANLPVEQVTRLNQDERVYLADPLASYVALVAADNPAVAAALSEARKSRVRQLQKQTGQEPPVEAAEADSFLNPQVEMWVRDLWPLLTETERQQVDQRIRVYLPLIIR